MSTETDLSSSATGARAINQRFHRLPTVIIEDSDIVAEALDLCAQGMDFADALHLLKARHCETFVTSIANS